MKGNESRSFDGQNYRHEFKYLITENQLCILRNRLDCIMKLDPYVQHSGFYSIRSLYFDDDSDSCFWDNRNGVDPREKYRIRIYNNSLDRIKLELKRKERGKTLKQSCEISKECMELLVLKNKLIWNENMNPLLKRLFILHETAYMAPRVIVEYDRIPYIEKNGNVRVTLDLNVRSTSRIVSFMDERIISRPIMPLGYHLLEVKYDNYIPDHIIRSLHLQGLMQTTFSKYYYCRKFGGITV